MIISWKWIFEYLDIAPTLDDWKRVDELKALLPLSGIEIAKVVSMGDSLDNIVIAKVLEVAKHPQADRLNVCKVNTGSETLQIVCGASNVKAGITIALAPVGAKLPGGLEIKAAKIRGVDSQGMICSESELGLAKESDGIMILPDALVLGQKFLDAIEVREQIWELELTPDRADCLSVLGMARELRRYFSKNGEWPSLKVPDRDFLENETKDVPIIKVEVQASKACPIYGAQLFESIPKSDGNKIQYAQFLSERLKALGVERLRNAPVDLANYVLFEKGNPLHTFDADQIVGAKIIVRFAKEGEKITTLDNIERVLSSEDLVIADVEKPLAIAGVMGSKDSGVSETTTRVLVESAYFDPELIRATAKRHKILSDAAYRYERGVDPQGVFTAAGRLSYLLRTQLGAKKRGAFVLVKADKADKLFETKSINLDLRKVEKTLGYEITSDVALMSLKATGIQCVSKSSNVLSVEVPTYRCDLHREIDLVEEIARVSGFDKIPSRYPTQTKSFEGVGSELFNSIQKLRAVASEQGYVEIAPYSFVGEIERNLFYSKVELQKLENPISEDWTYLRASLLPGILKNLSRHGSLRQRDVQVFEVGTVFEKNLSQAAGLKEKSLKTRESLHLSWGLMGHREETHWLQDKKSASKDLYRDFFDAKGFWEHTHEFLKQSDARWKNVELKALWKLNDAEKTKIDSWIPLSALHPGRSALLYVPALRSYRGFIGELHPEITSSYLNFPAGWKFPIAIAELRVFDDLWAWSSKEELSRKLGVKPRLNVEAPAMTPVVERDLSLLVKSDISHNQIVEVITKSAQNLEDLNCVDVFHLEDGQKSMTYRLLFQHAERTLTDDEIQKNTQTILADLNKNLSIVLR